MSHQNIHKAKITIGACTTTSTYITNKIITKKTSLVYFRITTEKLLENAHIN